MLILTYSVIGLLVQTISTQTIEDLLSKFQQNDFVLDFERVELVRYNKNYYKYFTIFTYKYNRTSPAVNASFESKVDLGNDMDIITQAYRFASNEYRLFPMRFEVNYCQLLKNNIMGMGSVVKCGNFTGCPQHKEKAHVCNWKPEASHFPPLIPDGRYKLEMQAFYHSTEIFVMSAYGGISRPII